MGRAKWVLSTVERQSTSSCLGRIFIRLEPHAEAEPRLGLAGRFAPVLTLLGL